MPSEVSCTHPSLSSGTKHFHIKKFLRIDTVLKVATHEICDGKWNCPAGNDELFNCADLSIVPAVRCTLEPIFVSYQHVGDNYIHCKQSYDDELGKYMSTFCASCDCQGLLIICRNITTSPKISQWTKVINVQGKYISGNIFTIIKDVKYLLSLAIVETSLSFLPENSFSRLIYLTVLNLHGNAFKAIAPKLFSNLQYLGKLILSGNPLVSVTPIPPLSLVWLDLSQSILTDIGGVFTMGNHIVQLNLSANQFTCIHLDHFEHMHAMKYLDISNNPTIDVIVDARHASIALSQLQVLHVVRPETCCLFQDISCKSDLKSEDSMGSCQEIIANVVMRYVLCIYLLLCTFTNSLAFIWTLLSNYKGLKSFHILECNLNMADGLTAVYLICLLVVDNIFQGDVGYVAFIWKHSILCQILSFIIMFSIQLSTMSTFLIAVDRFLIIVWHPFKKYGMTVCAAYVILPICWFACAILPVLSINLSFHRLSNNACILVGESLPLPYVITYLVINCVIFITLIALYIAVTKTLYKSKHMTKSQQISITPILLRLGLIVLTNLLCWLTVCIMAVLSLSGFPLVSSKESLVSLIIFPLNSITNPTINTLSTPKLWASLRGRVTTIVDKIKTLTSFSDT
jgi:hypothetical protein